MRIVSKWQAGDEAHSLEEIGKSLGFNAWKISYHAIQSMQNAKLYFVSRFQGLLVIAEFMTYQIQIADRLVFNCLNLERRQHFVQCLAGKCLVILNDNRADFQPPTEGSSTDFLDIFNLRLNEYAEFSFDSKQGPGYQFKRYLGEKVVAIMGENDQNNKWAIDQVMEIEAPRVYADFKKSFDSLYG